MIERLDPFVLSETQKENCEIAQWAFDSHYWIELMAGCLECKWCGAVHYSATCTITKDFPLCRGNYAVQKLLEKHEMDVYDESGRCKCNSD